MHGSCHRLRVWQGAAIDCASSRSRRASRPRSGLVVHAPSLLWQSLSTTRLAPHARSSNGLFHSRDLPQPRCPSVHGHPLPHQRLRTKRTKESSRRRLWKPPRPRNVARDGTLLLWTLLLSTRLPNVPRPDTCPSTRGAYNVHHREHTWHHAGRQE